MEMTFRLGYPNFGTVGRMTKVTDGIHMRLDDMPVVRIETEKANKFVQRVDATTLIAVTPLYEHSEDTESPDAEILGWMVARLDQAALDTASTIHEFMRQHKHGITEMVWSQIRLHSDEAVVRDADGDLLEGMVTLEITRYGVTLSFRSTEMHEPAELFGSVELEALGNLPPAPIAPSSSDYTMTVTDECAWIKGERFNVMIQESDMGLGVEVYELGKEDGALAHCYVSVEALESEESLIDLLQERYALSARYNDPATEAAHLEGIAEEIVSVDERIKQLGKVEYASLFDEEADEQSEGTATFSLYVERGRLLRVRDKLTNPVEIAQTDEVIAQLDATIAAMDTATAELEAINEDKQRRGYRG